MSKFSIYLDKLKKLDEKNSFFKKYENAEKIVFFLTGSGYYENASLSEEQKNILNIFKDFDYSVVESNFPYNKDFPHEFYKDINILKASYATAIYYLHTLFNENFKLEIKRNLENILKLKKVVIITQSSGLNILNRFLDFFDDEELKNLDIKVFALGSVAKKSAKLKNLDVTIVKGKYDEYSRLLDKHKVDKWIKCRHLTYLKNKDLLNFFREYLEENR